MQLRLREPRTSSHNSVQRQIYVRPAGSHRLADINWGCLPLRIAGVDGPIRRWGVTATCPGTLFSGRLGGAQYSGELSGVRFVCILISVKILLVALLASTAIVARSLDQLRQKYGNPVSETFAVRDGIAVTVKRAPDGAITEMLIVPMSMDSLVPWNMTLSYEAAKNVLDELLPSSKRGKFVIAGFVNVICLPENNCAGSTESYEKVSVYYNTAATPGHVRYVDVRFKK